MLYLNNICFVGSKYTIIMYFEHSGVFPILLAVILVLDLPDRKLCHNHTSKQAGYDVIVFENIPRVWEWTPFCVLYACNQNSFKVVHTTVCFIITQWKPQRNAYQTRTWFIVCFRGMVGIQGESLDQESGSIPQTVESDNRGWTLHSLQNNIPIVFTHVKHYD